MGDTEKRLVIFLILSVAIVYLFTTFSQPPQRPPAPPPATAPAPSVTAPETTQPTPELTTPAPETPPPAQTITIETPLYRAQLTSAGGVLTRWELKRYTETVNGTDPVVLFPPIDVAPAVMPLSLVVPGGDPAVNRAIYRVEGGDARLTKAHPSARVRFVADLAAPNGNGRPIHVEKELV
ncbi:MAG: membrane protein insertase YidC, partial [Nitrospirota bacterium]